MTKRHSKTLKRRSKRSTKRRSKTSKRRSKTKRRFGYSHDMGPRVYKTHMDDGILLADNAYNWQGNPEARAENA